jgi:hypothetical protein
VSANCRRRHTTSIRTGRPPKRCVLAKMDTPRNCLFSIRKGRTRTKGDKLWLKKPLSYAATVEAFFCLRMKTGYRCWRFPISLNCAPPERASRPLKSVVEFWRPPYGTPVQSRGKDLSFASRAAAITLSAAFFCPAVLTYTVRSIASFCFVMSHHKQPVVTV